MGQVVDISAGGMAFHYQPRNRSADSFDELVLICMDGGRLEKIPFTKVSDVEINDLAQVEFGPVRRASIRFGDLAHGQQEKLQTFIETCAVEDIYPA